MKLVVLVLLAIFALSGYAPGVHGYHTELYSAFRPMLKNKERERVKELFKSGRLSFGPDTTSEQKAQFVAMMLGRKGRKGRQTASKLAWTLNTYTPYKEDTEDGVPYMMDGGL